MSEENVTFENLCSMIERGMDHDQACEWAAQGGLHITEEQRDHLERDLEVFDTSALPTLHEGESLEDFLNAAADPTPASSPAPESGAKPQEVELKHLTQQERRNIILGLLIIIAVGTALVRFITI